MQAPNKQLDYKLEQLIGNLLRAGVFLAAIVVLAGGVLYLVQHGKGHPDYHSFHAEKTELRSPSGVIRDAAALDSQGIIEFGLLLLVLTPIARVVFSAAGFAMERDWMYVVITLIVLGVLIYSLLELK
jgi:uncharacterized membrane protein